VRPKSFSLGKKKNSRAVAGLPMSKKNKMACVVQSDPRERAFVVLRENNECDRSVVVDKKLEMAVVSQDANDRARSTRR
jgi:hypothetical protein